MHMYIFHQWGLYKWSLCGLLQLMWFNLDIPETKRACHTIRKKTFFMKSLYSKKFCHVFFILKYIFWTELKIKVTENKRFNCIHFFKAIEKNQYQIIFLVNNEQWNIHKLREDCHYVTLYLNEMFSSFVTEWILRS